MTIHLDWTLLTKTDSFFFFFFFVCFFFTFVLFNKTIAQNTASFSRETEKELRNVWSVCRLCILIFTHSHFSLFIACSFSLYRNICVSLRVRCCFFKCWCVMWCGGRANVMTKWYSSHDITRQRKIKTNYFISVLVDMRSISEQKQKMKANTIWWGSVCIWCVCVCVLMNWIGLDWIGSIESNRYTYTYTN